MIHILGGGISGLSLAYYLVRSGQPVSVYESSENLGGNCSWVKLEDQFVDRTYHMLTKTDNSLLDIMKEIGVDKYLYPVKTTMAFYHQKSIYPLTNIKEALQFSPLGWFQRIMLGISFMRSLSIRNWRPLDKILAKEWLSKIGSKGLYENFWKPIMNHKFGECADLVAATDMWFRLNRLFFTSLGKGQGKAYYLKGCFKIFFDRLESHLISKGVKIYKSHHAKKLEIQNGKITGITFSNQNKVEADTVVSTLPLPALSGILPDEFTQYKKSLEQVFYLNNICLILKTKEPIIPYYQLALSDYNIPFTGVISGAQLYSPEEYGGYITYITRYFYKKEELFQKSASEVLHEYEPFLKNINKNFSRKDVIGFHLTKEKHVESLHTINYSQMKPATKTPILGLLLLCTAQIYPEPTVLDTACSYAYRLANQIKESIQ